MSKRVALPQAIRAIREAKATSDPAFRVGQFATTCQLSAAHLCNIEAGRKAATVDVIGRIAEHLGVGVDAISYELIEAAA